jgi:methylenetetrahydrofolate reductase (NADPH)
MLGAMNRGLATPESNNSEARLQSTSFLKGVAFTPFKFLEAEVVMQYYKLHRKITAGADFVITQIGYDARKFHELLLYMKLNNLHVPVLGNVFIPNLAVTELMYQGQVPGCVITEALYRQVRKESKSEDKGKKARLVRGATLLAVLKGLGYAGAHIGGPNLSFSDLDFMLNSAKEIGEDWRSCIKETSFWPEKAFWFFEKDIDSGLNLMKPNERAVGNTGLNLGYLLSHNIHKLAFTKSGLLYNPLKKFCLAVDRGLHCGSLCRIEHTIKAACFGCQNCGDCTLAELAYLCPQSGCAKYLLNGPCGGSRDGWCEVYPGMKRCLFVKVYERLKAAGIDAMMKEGVVPPRDWSLHNTSSWTNFFAGRDHTRRRREKG